MTILWTGLLSMLELSWVAKRECGFKRGAGWLKCASGVKWRVRARKGTPRWVGRFVVGKEATRADEMLGV